MFKEFFKKRENKRKVEVVLDSTYNMILKTSFSHDQDFRKQVSKILKLKLKEELNITYGDTLTYPKFKDIHKWNKINEFLNKY